MPVGKFATWAFLCFPVKLCSDFDGTCVLKVGRGRNVVRESGSGERHFVNIGGGSTGEGSRGVCGRARRGWQGASRHRGGRRGWGDEDSVRGDDRRARSTRGERGRGSRGDGRLNTQRAGKQRNLKERWLEGEAEAQERKLGQVA